METSDARSQAITLASDALTEALGRPITVQIGWKGYTGTHPVGVISRRIRGLVEDAFRNSPQSTSVDIPAAAVASSAIGVWVLSISASVEVKETSKSNLVVPQANSYERLSEYMHAWQDGHGEETDQMTQRTQAYYAELAEVLGWVTRDRAGVHCTPKGETWLQADATVQRETFAADLWATPVMQATAAAQNSGLPLNAALQKVISKTGLSDATVVRRTLALMSLVTAGEPSAVAEDDAPQTLEEPSFHGLGAALSEGNGSVAPWFFQGLEAKSEAASEGLVEESERNDSGRRGDAVSVLNPPSLLLRVLDRLGVTTVGDVVDLGLQDIRSIPGVGRLKTVQLRELVQAARGWTGAEDSGLEEDTDVDNVWEHVRSDDPWRPALARLSDKAKTALERAGYRTLGDVRANLENLANLHAIGGKTVAHIHEHFDNLTTHGTEAYLFGEAGTPSSVEDLLQRAFAELDERERDMVNRHELGDETLEEIGRSHELTRARVQQIIARSWPSLTDIYAEVATDLLAPEIAKLERPGNLMVCRTEDEAKRLDLAIQLTGYNPPRHKRVLSKKERPEFEAQIQALRQGLEDAGQTSMDLEDALDIAESAGMMIERDELMRLLEDHWKVTFVEGRVVFPWFNIGDILAEELLELGHASDIREILVGYDARRAEPAWADLPELNDHAGRAHVARAANVWNMAHGLYIHQDRLPFPIEDLHAAVDWALDYLDGRQDAIGANILVNEMTAARVLPAGMTPHLLKDGIYRHPLGQTFKNNLLVARTDSFAEDGISMKDRVTAFLNDATEPLHWKAAARGMRTFGYATTSVQQMLSNDPDLVGIGGGYYTTLAHLQVSIATRDQLISEAFALLPDDGQVKRSDEVYAGLSTELQSAIGVNPNILEVMEWLVRLDGRVDAAHGLMARGDGGSLVRAAVQEIIDQMGVAYPHEVRTKLVDEFGYRGNPGNVHVSLQKLSADGRLLKLPGSLYSTVGKDEAATWKIWEKRREIVMSASVHADALEYEPAAMWSLICYIERLVDDDDLAAKLLVEYLKRDDLSSVQRQNASDLKFALSMGMG